MKETNMRNGEPAEKARGMKARDKDLQLLKKILKGAAIAKDLGFRET